MDPTTDKIRILIVDDIGEQREHIKRMLQFEPEFQVVGTASDGQEAIELSKQYRPHIVLMDINMRGMDGITATEIISRELPQTQVVMMSVQSESDYLRRALSAGAREFLFKPFGFEELVPTLHRVYDRFKHLWQAVPQELTLATPEASLRPTKLAKTVALYSPKGGVGCTTLAINLAVTIRQLDPQARVAVIDGDLQFGSVDIALNIHDKRSIVDLGDDLADLDAELLLRTMADHSRSQVKVLRAPPKPELAELITADHIRAVLGVAQEAFDYLVIDVGSRLHDVELSILDMVDRIVLVIAPDLTAIRHARHFFELIEVLEYPLEKVLMVLNRCYPWTGISAQAIARSLKHDVFAEIPAADQIVLESTNRGIPYIMMPHVDKRSPLIQSTGRFAQRIVRELEKVEEE
jgi:pilus assembly protein CpaE